MDTDFSNFFQLIQLHPPTVGAIIALIASFVLLGASGFISASEIAFFSLSPLDRSVISNRENIKDQLIDDLLDHPEHLLATILIANNFVNVSVVILCNFFLSSVINFSVYPVIEFLVQTVVLTFLLVLFGEIMPKVYATYNTLKFARFSAQTMTTLIKIFSPFSAFLVLITNVVNKKVSRKNQNISMIELSQALELTSHEIKDEKMMLEGIIQFGHKTVAEVMTPRVSMTDIDIRLTYPQVMKLVVDSGYSRIPVYEGTEDTIKGILYIKDLLPHLNKDDDFNWQSLIRPAYFVPDTKKIDDLLEVFRSDKIHMAIVVDEFGGTSGIITLEDILEEIVGEISDEFDVDERLYTKIDDQTYIFEAQILLNDFYRITGIDSVVFEKLSEDAETLAGLILELKSDFPVLNEVITYHGYKFIILEIDKRRIKKVKFVKKEDNLQV